MSNQQRDLVADLERCRRVAAYGTTVAYSSSNKEAEELHGDMFGMLLHVLPRAIRAEARVKELERIRQAAAGFLRTLVSARQQHCARLCDFLGRPMPPLVRNDDVCRQCESGACSVPGMLAILADWEAQSDERLMGVSAIQQAGFRAQAAGRGAC